MAHRLALSFFLLAAALASAASAADILLLRDGSRRTGTLQACTQAQCRFDGKTIARPVIYRIGLSTHETAGPAPADPTRDEVRLRDGAIHAGRIAGVSLGVVATESGSYDRADVAWLYFAPEFPGPAGPTGTTGPTGPTGPIGGPGSKRDREEDSPPPPPDKITDPPPGDEPPPERPPRRPPREPDDPARECPPERPLGGRVEIRLHGVQEQQYSHQSLARFWFGLAPQSAPGLRGKRWVAQPFVASELTWDLRTSACVDLPGTGGFATEVCSCPGGSASGRAALGSGDEVVYNAMRPELTLRLPDEIRYSVEVPLRCTSQTGETQSEVGWHLDSRYDISPDCTHLCVAPTACEPDASDPCAAHPERYAVLPFEGKARIGGDGLTEEVSWRVCCGCGDRGAPPDMSRDPCGDLEQYRKQVERAAAVAKALRDQLDLLTLAYQNHRNQAQNYSSNYDLYLRRCGQWEKAMELMALFAGGPGAPKAAQAFVAWFGIMEKVSEGDPSVILAILGQAFEGVDAAEGVLDLGGELGDISYEDLWDMISDARSDMLDDGSIDSIRQHIADCSGTPIVSDPVYQDALKFVEEMAAMLELQTQMDSLATKITQAEVQHWEWQWQAYNACLQWAACKGIDPSTCGAPPAAPR